MWLALAINCLPIQTGAPRIYCKMAIRYRQTLFLATPRTASNSLFYLLRQMGGKMVGDHHDIPRHMPSKLKDVAVVRNHFDWLVTSWIKATWRSNDPAFQRLPFDEWLRQIHLPDSPHRHFTFPGYVEVAGHEGSLFGPLRQRCHALLHYENLETELRQLLSTSDSSLPRWNTTPHKKDYKKYYNNKTRALVENLYGEELELFGYDFDNGRVWQPRDDDDALRGGGLFNPRNQRRPRIREYRDWPNLPNNPD